MPRLAFLIPITSKNRPWKEITECYLLNYTFKSFLETKSDMIEYAFYLGFDNDDKLFTKKENLELLQQTFDQHNIKLNITLFEGIKKGHVTVMWNQLFKKAYDDNYDYFFQCGDDIEYRTNGWLWDSMKMLVKNKGVGVSGPNNNPNVEKKLLTQSMVSRKHMEIFGYFFPPSIENWYCDDWITDVYSPHNIFKLNEHYAPNLGGEPRYKVNFDKSAYLYELMIGRQKLIDYVEKMKKGK
jgi:hypothetical protein